MATNEQFLVDQNIIGRCELDSTFVTRTTTILTLPYTAPYYLEDGVVYDKQLFSPFSPLCLPLSLGLLDMVGDKWILHNKRFYERSHYLPRNVPIKWAKAPLFTFTQDDPYTADDMLSPTSEVDWMPLNITVFAGIEVIMRRGYPCPVHDSNKPKLFVVKGADVSNKLRTIISGRMVRGGVQFSGFGGMAQQYLTTLFVKKDGRRVRRDALTHDLTGVDIVEAHEPADLELARICRDMYLEGMRYILELNLPETLNIFNQDDVNHIVQSYSEMTNV